MGAGCSNPALNPVVWLPGKQGRGAPSEEEAEGEEELTLESGHTVGL